MDAFGRYSLLFDHWIKFLEILNWLCAHVVNFQIYYLLRAILLCSLWLIGFWLLSNWGLLRHLWWWSNVFADAQPCFSVDAEVHTHFLVLGRVQALLQILLRFLLIEQWLHNLKMRLLHLIDQLHLLTCQDHSLLRLLCSMSVHILLLILGLHRMLFLA